MCWFFKKKKKKKEVLQSLTATRSNIISSTPTTTDKSKPLEPDVTKAYDKNQVPKVETKEVEITSSQAKPKETKTNVIQKKPVTKKQASTNQYSGKYEIYPEAGYFKFRLKASNGEILAVSFGYTSLKGAQSGIETFKKNVETGVFDLYTDKSDYSQFVLYTSNRGRVIILGEFYNNLKQAESSVESVKKFYLNEKIEILDDIKDDEVREEIVEFENVPENDNGKYEIYLEEGLYYSKLKANNAQVLFVSTGYATKASCKQGLETIKKAIQENRFTVARDKFKRYKFNLYSSTNQLILTGETYPVKGSCLSAINSVRKFAMKAKVIEL